MSNRQFAIVLTVVGLIVLAIGWSQFKIPGTVAEEMALSFPAINENTTMRFWRECRIGAEKGSTGRWSAKRSGCLAIPKSGYGKVEAVDVTWFAKKPFVIIHAFGSSSPSRMLSAEFLEKYKVVFWADKDYVLYSKAFIEERELVGSDCPYC